MGRLSDLALRREARLCSVDLNLDLARYASTRVDGPRPLCIQGDITALPLAENSMDAAACVRISQYFDDAALTAVLREVARVSGDILLSYRSSRSPVSWPRRFRKYLAGGSASIKRYRSRRQIGEIAAAAGLRFAKPPPHSLFFYLTQFVRLTRTEPPALPI